MLATLDRGDTVLVPNPSYPIHIYGAVIAGADIRSVQMTRDVDFFAELARAIRESFPKPKMMILGFPSNPTAQCVDLDFFERVIALARAHGIYVVHDLAYADITFDGYKSPSIMQVPGARDVAVEFFTMSKSYNMAGWRIGFMVGNRELVSALARIKSYHDYGTFTPIQVASIAALEGPQECIEEIRAQYQRRRDVLAKGLHEAGWMVEVPKASMYIWAEIPQPYKALGSLEFAK
jgi:alanine-synthesizing transaminase